jgi:hypothetical protein
MMSLHKLSAGDGYLYYTQGLGVLGFQQVSSISMGL